METLLGSSICKEKNATKSSTTLKVTAPVCYAGYTSLCTSIPWMWLDDKQEYLLLLSV